MSGKITRLGINDRLEVISRFSAIEGEGTLTCRDCGKTSTMEWLTPTQDKLPAMNHEVDCVFSKVRRALKMCETMATI